jgi:hypothetical protein
MNASDKLQLIRALEESESSRRRRSDLLAWGSVALAALVLGVMIMAGRLELKEIERRVHVTRDELNAKQAELKATERALGIANDNYRVVQGANQNALRTLQNVDGRSPSAGVIESAVDNLLDVNIAAPAPPADAGSTDSDRAQLIRQLFDPSGAVRLKAYGGLLPRYKDDPTLVPEILKVAEENPRNANGIYNALVVLSHMNASSLRPHSKEIRSFAEGSQSVGPRVAERARTLLGRLPK